MNRDIALSWLYGQLRKKRIALANAERKPGVKKEEIDDIQSAIDTIDWIIGKVLEAPNELP